MVDVRLGSKYASGAISLFLLWVFVQHLDAIIQNPQKK